MSILPHEERIRTFQDFINDPKRIAAIAAIAPSHLTPERIIKLARNAVVSNPGLLECTMASIYTAVIRCASMGWDLSADTGQAYLVPFYNKNTKQKECTLVPGYRGYLDLCWRSGFVRAVEASAVYEGDDFSFRHGSESFLHHVPRGLTESLTHSYVLFHMKGGLCQFKVLFKKDIERVRTQFSKQGDGQIWREHYAVMGIKTAIRQGVKLVPMSPELSQVLEMDRYVDTGEYNPLGDIFDPKSLAAQPSTMAKVSDRISKAAEMYEEEEYAPEGILTPEGEGYQGPTVQP